MVKGADEIARLERSAAINEQAAMEGLQLLGPGRCMVEAIAHYRRRAAELGAEFDHFAFGYAGIGMATESQYVLKENDVLCVDFGCVYQHYFPDTGTTLALCELTEVLEECYAALRECSESGMEAIRPGVRASAVQAAMQGVLNACDIAASFPHGHGLGLEIRDYPILVADNELRIRDDCVDVPSDLPLEADMVINLEVSLALPGVGSLLIEKSFVVTADGSRELVPHDRSRPVRPGRSTDMDRGRSCISHAPCIGGAARP